MPEGAAQSLFMKPNSRPKVGKLGQNFVTHQNWGPKSFLKHLGRNCKILSRADIVIAGEEKARQSRKQDMSWYFASLSIEEQTVQILEAKNIFRPRLTRPSFLVPNGLVRLFKSFARQWAKSDPASTCRENFSCWPWPLLNQTTPWKNNLPWSNYSNRSHTRDDFSSRHCPKHWKKKKSSE